MKIPFYFHFHLSANYPPADMWQLHLLKSRQIIKFRTFSGMLIIFITAIPHFVSFSIAIVSS